MLVVRLIPLCATYVMRIYQMSAGKRGNGATIIIPPRHQLCDHFFFVLKIIEFIGQRNFAMPRAKLNDEVVYVI